MATPTARAIVFRMRLFVNGVLVDKGVCPTVQFLSIKTDALFANDDFSDIRANASIEFPNIHPKVLWCQLHSDEARLKDEFIHFFASEQNANIVKFGVTTSTLPFVLK